MSAIVERLRGGVVAAVPAPFRDGALDRAAQQEYARSLAAEPLAGVAVWAHTGRGPHLGRGQRHDVLASWRAGLPGKLVIAGVSDADMLRDAESGGADAVLVFPVATDPIRHHEAMSRQLPVILFWLYEGAGGVAYDDATLHRLLDLPNVIGIKIATLDSVMTFQRLAALVRQHPGKLVVTGEDRFFGYSIMCGADCALIGLAAALPALSCALFQAKETREAGRFLELSATCDRFAAATFREPMEGYVRRMLWAAAAEGRLPPEACDDPWGPVLPMNEQDDVIEAVRHARSALARL